MISQSFHSRNDLRCVAAVVEGTGFWGSAMRSMMGNAHLAAHSETSSVMRIHGSIDEVMSWLPAEHARRTGVVLDRGFGSMRVASGYRGENRREATYTAEQSIIRSRA